MKTLTIEQFAKTFKVEIEKSPYLTSAMDQIEKAKKVVVMKGQCMMQIQTPFHMKAYLFDSREDAEEFTNECIDPICEILDIQNDLVNGRFKKNSFTVD